MGELRATTLIGAALMLLSVFIVAGLGAVRRAQEPQPASHPVPLETQDGEVFGGGAPCTDVPTSIKNDVLNSWAVSEEGPKKKGPARSLIRAWSIRSRGTHICGVTA